MRESVGQLAMMRRNLASIAGGRLLSPDKRVSTGHPSLDAALEAAYARGVKELPQGRNWIALPDGLALELIQSKNDAVARALSIDPRA